MGKTYRNDRDTYFDDGYGDRPYKNKKNKEHKIKDYQEIKKSDKSKDFPSDNLDGDDHWDEQF